MNYKVKEFLVCFLPTAVEGPVHQQQQLHPVQKGSTVYMYMIVCS